MKYTIGVIKKTHGLKGEVLVKSLTDFERFKKDEIVYIEVNNQYKELKIRSVKDSTKGLIISFYDLHHISHVDSFRGSYLYTDQEPTLEENEYHVDDLIGKEVYDQNNNYVGVVKDVEDVPQGHLLRITTENKEALVPFNEVFVEDISEVIKINVIEGLL